MARLSLEAAKGKRPTIGGRRCTAVKTVDSKSEILEKAGYIYSLDRMMYVNRQARKVFSEEFVDDHSDDEIRRCVDEGTGEQGWRFYVNSPLSEGVKRELETLLG
jgi:hypothetical protein